MADQRRRRAERAAQTGDEEAGGRAARDAVRAGQGGERVAISLRLPAELLERADRVAEVRGETRTALIEQGLEVVLGDASPLGAHGVYMRHGQALRDALRELALPRDEACLCMDALNGYEAMLLSSPGLGASPSAIALEVHDAIRLNRLDEKWLPGRVKAQRERGDALVQRLRGMTPIQALALADAAATFWRLTHVETDAALAAAGLI